ncbi:hypothetical protein [Sansalvadorimonas verongulae]|uniref:hypothetical protein n=1 Tax=Sansalvadorimonas verongulae TaxID=2172824 RepID=UPI0012BCC708|nr:hypothetical protein [Sansalvadorimonas verongulae]MTI13225.1 hypothetical protein [Sansalvadorimonas verongulae]
MINKKSPSSDTGVYRHQELLDKFRSSQQTPKEFITQCLQEGMVSGADALELMSVLQSKITTRSFALADLSDDDHFRQGLYETNRDDSENNPIFVVQFDQNLIEHSEAIQEMLETFARSMAEFVSQHEDAEEIRQIDVSCTREEAMETILESLPGDSARH